MNVEIVQSNENQNDGTLIHLFYTESLDMWVAYGYSAYALRLYVKARGRDNLRSFSYTLQLPCTIVGNETIKEMRKTVAIKEEQEDYLVFAHLKPFDKTDYLRWTDKLRHERGQKEGMNIDTPVSQYVSKDTFILDGMSAFSRNVKRIGDLTLASIALLLFSPLFLACYMAVKREDHGPAIFKQERIGRFGKPFYIYKFRSMRLDAEALGPQLSHSGGSDDPRLTKVGRFLRAHHLDELPQLWNVFCGDMAFIGPRPERKFYIDQILEYDKRYTYLYQIRPGVTSYATLYNGYTDTMEKMLRRLEYDLYYLGHRSWWFDFKVLVHTFCAIVFGKKF